MKVLAWILNVFWGIAILILVFPLVSGTYTDDLLTNLIALALFVAQVYFNFMTSKKLK